MKYIRTKDNLYESESTFVDYKGKTIYQTVKNGIFDKMEIVKVGDGITELLDKIIVGKADYPVSDFNGLVHGMAIGCIKKQDIYGAIWVDMPNDAPSLKAIAIWKDDKGWTLI